MAPQLSTAEMPPETSASHGGLENAPPAPRRGQVLLGVAVGAAVVVSMALIYWFHEPLLAVFAAPAPKLTKIDEPFKVLGNNQITIAAESPLHHRLKIAEVKRESLEYPLLNVSGYVMARLAPGADQASSRWDFANAEVATAYGDWLHAREDVLVLEKQAEKTRDLVDIKVKYLKKELARKEDGNKMGAISDRDYVAAKAEYLQADIQGQKDITEAESALKKAERNRGLLERQLLLSGVDPEVIRKASEGLVLVVAEVPEAKIGLVKADQACEAKFFGVPDLVYHGRVGRLGPSVAKEKRTLRVTFELNNPGGKLLPGMFAEIGLGAETRQILTVPVESVLHAENSDYVMKEETAGHYRAIKITVDEPRQVAHSGTPHGPSVACIPVLEGLHEGDRVVSTGAILLKPVMVKALAHNNNGSTTQ
jgi:multidrug efflux pump subunit AcrA (membrane-fusion protein)